MTLRTPAFYSPPSGGAPAESAGAVVRVLAPQLADGATVTLTKGVTSKSALVASGVAEFSGVSFGSWTVSGGGFARPLAVTEARIYEIALVRVYAYQIRKDDANPATRVSYPRTLVVDGVAYPVENHGHQPLRNVSGVGVTYGSWTGEEFFFPRPCMVTYSGAVDYYLDPANYAYALDGAASDVGSLAYDGNAMVEFPTAWVLRREDAVDGVTYETFVLAEAPLSADFAAYAHKDAEDGTLGRLYVGAFEGCKDSANRLRSIAGQTILVSTPGCTADQDPYAEAAGASFCGDALANDAAGGLTGARWFLRTWAQWCYLQDLTILLTRSTDGQAAIGRGNVGDGSAGTAIATSGGTLAWGLFGGAQTNSAHVKCLGIEDLWGNHWKHTPGRSLVSGYNYIKMAVDGSDGTTGKYNFTGNNGYNTGQPRLATTNGFVYPGAYKFAARGRYGSATGGSTSTYCCDGEYYGTATASTALVGGNYARGLSVGPVCASMNYAFSISAASVAASLSLVLP